MVEVVAAVVVVAAAAADVVAVVRVLDCEFAPEGNKQVIFHFAHPLVFGS